MVKFTWCRHQMETFSALLALCVGNSPVTGDFPAQRPMTRSFDIFFDLRLNNWLSKQSWGWWSETLSHPLWRHRNEWSSLYRDNPMLSDNICPRPKFLSGKCLLSVHCLRIGMDKIIKNHENPAIFLSNLVWYKSRTRSFPLNVMKFH